VADIKDIIKQKEALEKRIFNMLHKFQKEHNIVITDIQFWADEEDPTTIDNITLTTRLIEQTDRNLIKMEKDI